MEKKSSKKKQVKKVQAPQADLGQENPLAIGAMPDDTVTEKDVDEAQHELSDDYEKDQLKSQ